MSYCNTGDRDIPSVHIQLLKEFVPRKNDPKTSRVTSVFDPDTASDILQDRYAEAQVRGEEVDDNRAKDMAS